MAIEIPLFQDQSADFSQNINVENINVQIRIRYNTRTETWFCNLSSDNYQLNGLKLVRNFPLLWRHKALFPEVLGDFIILKISDKINNNDLNYDTLGVNYGLFYITQDELNTWVAFYGLNG